MRMRWHWSVGLLFALMSLLPLASQASDQDDQRRVATQFIKNYFLSDLRSLTRILPTEPQSLFGPYPFTGTVTFGEPKVDEFQAALPFTATPLDGKYPKTGAIIFRRVYDDWFVRQVLIYNRLPAFFPMPKKSKTARDRAYEPAVRAVGQSFITAWMRGDTKTMCGLWYDWTKVEREPEDNLTVSDVKVTPTKTAWGDPYIAYSARLTYRFGILSYASTVKGGLLLAKEHGEYRVCGNTLVLDF